MIAGDLKNYEQVHALLFAVAGGWMLQQYRTMAVSLALPRFCITTRRGATGSAFSLLRCLSDRR